MVQAKLDDNLKNMFKSEVRINFENHVQAKFLNHLLKRAQAETEARKTELTFALDYTQGM